ncbi:MAG: hypothetical protein ABSF34_14755 [Verrucomicrobiota bacterium]|jgi:hypothetical protein
MVVSKPLVITGWQGFFNPPNAFTKIPPRQCREAMPGLLPDIALKHDEMFLIFA